MRTPLIAGNWKMNTTTEEATSLVINLLKPLDEITGVEKLVCPPFISLKTVSELLAKSSVKVGAQNVHYEEKGAFTGEVSPLMIKEYCEYVIIGHSERRQYFNDDLYVNRKLITALKFGITPILCIGENLEDNQADRTVAVLERQLDEAFLNIENIGGLVIAYEPIWAIGTGKSASPEQAGEIIGKIRNKVCSLFGQQVASEMRILYGGSANAENITELMGQEEIDGALVGGASLKSDQFISMVEQTSIVYKNCQNRA
ncbi:MAG: triose-phosphate isomerase [Dehalococcoidales bacterium]